MRFLNSLVPICFPERPHADKSVWRDEFSKDMDKCEAISQLTRANPAITQELASILEKTDDAAGVFFLSAIDDLRKSFAHCYKCQGSIGDMLETFTNEVNTKYDSKLFISTSKVIEDFKRLQSLKDGANEDILERVGYVPPSSRRRPTSRS